MIVGKRKTKGEVTFDIVNALILLIVCLCMLLPVWHMLVVSLSNALAVSRGEVSFWPVGINFKAYRALLSNKYIPRSFLNSVVYTVLGTAVNMVMTVLCAYPLSRKHFYGRNFFAFLIIFTMFFNAGMISNYMVVKTLHLRNTIFAIIFPGAISVMNMVIMRTFFQGIPQELYESAYLDGATKLQQMRYITLPCLMPTIAILLILQVGELFGADFQKIMLMYSPLTYETADVISTYVYRSGVRGGALSYSTAVGFFLSVISFLFVFAADRISNRISDISVF